MSLIALKDYVPNERISYADHVRLLEKIGRAPITALLISDGRPGHFRLSEGVLAAIGKYRPVRIKRLNLTRPKWMPPRVLAQLTNSRLAPETILRQVYGIRAEDVPMADLIVSSGGDTLAANVAIRKLHPEVSNIFYGSLRSYHSEDFTTVLTSNIADAGRPNHCVTLKPSDIDNAPLRFRPGTSATGRPTVPRRAGLIIGGPAGLIVYKKEDWDRLFQFIRDLHSQFGTRWTIANAPRTPKHISDHLAEVAADPDNGVDSYIDVRTSGPGSLAPLYETSEAIVCTADSSSGVSEAVWALRPCVAVMPSSGMLSANEKDYRAWLSGENWTRDVAITDLSPWRFIEAYRCIETLQSDPFEQLAEQLQPYLPDILAAG